MRYELRYRSKLPRVCVPIVAIIALALAASGTEAGTQSPAGVPASTSSPKAKELVSVLQAKKPVPETFATGDRGTPGRYVAVTYVPGAQLLVVAAVYERPSDIDYRIYQKDFAGAYADLRQSVMAKDRIYIEDVFCDGLIAVPGKNQPGDTAMVDTSKRVFDGLFKDPKKPNDRATLNKPALEEYAKHYGVADEHYAKMLDILLAELKK